jgi:tight adherence protein B
VSTLGWIKFGCLMCTASSVITLALLLDRETTGMRLYHRYVAELERRLRLLFAGMTARRIVLLQAAAALLGLSLFAASSEPRALLILPVAALAPYAVLEWMHRQRVRRIESKLDGFALSLANALRPAPNIAAALTTILPGTPSPLDQEIELVLREIRVGSTLDQALHGFGARVNSVQLDVVLSGLMIGRKVGGNVPEILENTASTLREMARLAGVLRAKTADGRIQAIMLAIFPVGVVFVFDALSPGYFAPLTETAAGLIVTALAAGCWIISVLLARRILAVAL